MLNDLVNLNDSVNFNIENLPLEKPKLTVKETLKFLTPLASLIHLAFLVLFAIKGVEILALYNLFSVLLYLSISIWILRKSFALAILIIFIEVLTHSFMCDYYIGWEYGFFLYTLCCIPAIYYASMEFKGNLVLGNICSIILIISLSFMKITSGIKPGIFESNFANLKLILYIINFISACFILITLIVAYIYEMNFAQQILKKRNEILNYAANTDPLTKLLNRRGMQIELEKAVSEFKETKTKFAILIGDIDNFKSFNDTYGHNVGDLILVAISDVLRQFAFENENINVSRWGGEEFLIIVRNTNLSKIKEIGESILEDIRACKIPYEGSYLSITMTFGGSIYKKELDNIDDVIKNADKRLYLGKSNTKDCLVM